MLTINQLAQMEAVTHKSKMPKDIAALLTASYFSESRQEQVAIGDLTLPHFIRVMRSRAISDCSNN